MRKEACAGVTPKKKGDNNMDPNYEAAVEYMERAEKVEAEVQDMIERLDFLRSSLTGSALNTDADRVQTSPKDRMGEVCAQIADLDTQINQKIDRLADIRAETYDTLKRYVHDGLARDILVKRYLYFHDLRDICRRKRISYRTVRRVHNKGLWQLSRKFKKRS